MKTRFLTPILFVAFTSAVSTSYAKDEITPPSPLSGLYECTVITDDTSRLACFDSKVAGIRQAEDNKELVAIDKESAKTLKKEAFGFNLPSLPKLGLPSLGIDDDEEVLTMAVKSLRKSGRDYVLVLENGQVWRQTGGRFNYIPKGDLVATIKPASLGSYMLSISTGSQKVRGMKIRRVE